MRILFYDLETTGLSRQNNEILNIAAIVYNEETECIEAEYNKYIKPKNGVPWNITQLTGITNAMVADSQEEGLTLYDFMQFVRAQNCDAHAGHNISKFDDLWIEQKTKSYAIKNELPKLKIDTLPMAQQAYAAGVLENYNYTTGKGNISFKQEYLMDYWNLGVQEHLALTDVQYNIQVYVRLKEALEKQDFGF